ncbi:hypothetical protein IEO21_06452 [Rhodonia placenta]|uniref:Uncharacterized protein n=1 Tax=Rhodonia placenta TaxID=104341 RepID=A0A8H7U1B4_9APHY|nr:hypothetical protein IEO21_06452 [Postia placenta]
MTAVSNPCGKSPRVYPWGSVCNLRLDENVWWKFSSCSIARLLRALPSLENLEFATADSHLANVEITGWWPLPSMNWFSMRDRHSTILVFFSKAIDTTVLSQLMLLQTDTVNVISLRPQNPCPFEFMVVKRPALALHERGTLGIEICDENWRVKVRLGLICSDETNSWTRYDSITDKDGNVRIVEDPAFEGGASSEAMAAYTAWKRSHQTRSDRQSTPEPQWPTLPQRWMTEVTARGRAYAEDARGVNDI